MARSAAFPAKKRSILCKLARGGADYSDKSPKGTVDEQITELVHEINAIDGLVTTSSCAGRISVFLESPQRMRRASTFSAIQAGRDQESGQSDTGRWLFSSHTPLAIESERLQKDHFLSMFSLRFPDGGSSNNNLLSGIQSIALCQCIHFKFEPVILHIATASLEDAQTVLKAALDAGLRESGVVNFEPAPDGAMMPMVAVRSTGLASDTVIGYRDPSGNLMSIVDENYLRALVEMANDRFRMNGEKRDRFRYALRNRNGDIRKSSLDREDPILRKERKRAEGLRRQMAERKDKSNQVPRQQKSSGKVIEKGDDIRLEQELGLSE
ncbi:MAG: hypothetical protein M1821_008301 [Bathelium mastoideum]|nr:MAG: hypothetical protein M1821_008301 [Bathelium mastoideum]